MNKPQRRPAAVPELPKAPSTGHPARLPRYEDDPELLAQSGRARAPDQQEQDRVHTPKGEKGVTAVAEDLPMPPAKQREVRDVFGTKLRLDTIERVKNFATAHNTKIQDVVEMALDEFMTRRGG